MNARSIAVNHSTLTYVFHIGRDITNLFEVCVCVGGGGGGGGGGACRRE